MSIPVTDPAPRPSGPRVLLTVEAAAERLSISRTRVSGLIRDNEIDSIRVGRLRRIPVDALHDFTARLLDASRQS